MPLVNIVILNWNGFEDTSECIGSILNISYDNYNIIVVDNGSDKDESKEISTKFPEVITLRSETNLGFSAGNNLGIKWALRKGADYILLLNNDTIVEKNFLDILVDNASKNRTVGLAVPKINYYSDPSKVWYAGGYISKFRGAALTEGNGKSDSNQIKNAFVTFATACCLLIDKRVINDIGLMDENYFLYLEDADYCIRSSKHGYKILFVAQSKIYHKINESTTKEHNYVPLYYNTRNRLIFIKKFYKNIFYISLLYLICTFLFKSMIGFLTGDFVKVKVIYLAFRDFFLKKYGKVDLHI